MNQERLMNQEIDNEEITIDLTELFMALWSRLHPVREINSFPWMLITSRTSLS